MEYPCLTMISDAISDNQITETIVHENAHQWWYGLVGNNQTAYSWMDEGLAQFSTLLFFENYKDYNLDTKLMISSAMTSYKLYYNVYNQLLGEVNTSMNRNLNEYLSEYEYINIAYNKSLLMFDNLRSGIGDKKFFKAIQSYFETYKYSLAAPENLIGCFEKSGANSNEYFNSWIDGKVLI
jgi:aminopeptidase N